MPKQICFLLFYGFTCDFLEFPSVKSSQIFTAYRFLRDTNFTEGNARKFTVRFACCAHVDVIKYRKTVTFSFERAQMTQAFVLDRKL